MSLTNLTTKTPYAGNGVATVFPFGFKIYLATDIVVTETTAAGVTSTLVLNTDYTVTGLGLDAGGSITRLGATSPPPTGTTGLIRRVLPLTQTADIRNQSAFYASVHEDVFDKLTMVDQQQEEEIGRCLQIPEAFSLGVSNQLPKPLAGATLAWDPTATFLQNANSASSPFETLNPAMDGTATPGIRGTVTRGDHVHPAPLASVIPFTQAGTGAVASTVDAKLKQSVSVVDFGADATGVADSTTAFNSALATGKAVYVPAGTYLLTALAALTGSFRLYGDGRASILNFNTTGVGIQLTQVSSVQRISGSIQRLAFKQTTNVPAAFIRNTGYLNLLIDECYFSDTSATYCIDNYVGYGPTIRKCVFSDVTGSGIRFRYDSGAATYYTIAACVATCDFTRISVDAIDVEGVQGLSVDTCSIESCGGWGINTGSGGGGVGVESWGINIKSCDFEANVSGDLNLGTDGSNYCGVATMTDCAFNGPVNHTIALGSKSVVHMNSCYGVSAHPITITGSANAAAVLVNCSFVNQSGSFAWTDLSGGNLKLTSPSAVATVGSGGGAVSLRLNSANNNEKAIYMQTAGVTRWYCAGSIGNETGSNAGSNFRLQAYDDSGVAIDIPISITRAAGGTIAFAAGRPITLGGRSTFPASTAGASSANFPIGVTVTSPAAGDLWNDANGTLNFKGNFAATGYVQSVGRIKAIVTKTGTYTVLNTDETILADATTAAFTISLPSAPTTGEFHTFLKKDSSANLPTISGNGKNINGAGTYTGLSAQYNKVSVQYDGTAWFIVG